MEATILNPSTVSWVVFACVFSGALLGILLGSVLPEHHLSPASKELVRLGMGLLATMAALVIGLLIASAKTSFDAENDRLKEFSVDLLMLDRALAHYGSEAQDTRDLIRRAVELRLATTWPQDQAQATRLDTVETMTAIEGIEKAIRALEPRGDTQRDLQTKSLGLIDDVQRTRWLLFEGAGNTIPMPFLVALVVWVALILGSFGLMAPRNATVFGVLLVCALSIAGALFLILELDHPFDGLMRLSSEPLRYVLVRLGR